MTYINWKPQADSLRTVVQAQEILEDYMDQGYTMTLRQLYYQFVSRDLCTNTQKSYSRLGDIVTKARMAGMLDWDGIEDRGRQPTIWSEYNSVSDALEEPLRGFRLPRLHNQPTYVELWVEKDALSGVLSRVAAEYHVPVMVNKGYSSASAMRAAAERIRDACESYNSSAAVVLYLGDLDPSGEDMVRDVTDRIRLFADDGQDEDGYRLNESLEFEVKKLALNPDQVAKYRPPPNPAKMTDSRAKEYIKKFGKQSWEVDALPPEVLSEVIRDAIELELDLERMEKVKREEKRQLAEARKALKAVTDKLRKSSNKDEDD
jgi:hypothetical protein